MDYVTSSMSLLNSTTTPEFEGSGADEGSVSEEATMSMDSQNTTFTNNNSFTFAMTSQPQTTSSASTTTTTTIIMTTTTTDQSTSHTISTTQEETTTTGTSSIYPFGLELWHIIVIVAGLVILIVLLILLICCLCKRKKSSQKHQKKTMEDMWNVGTGGAEIPMIDVTSNSKTWRQSVDSTIDKITNVGEQSVAVNVFATDDNDEPQAAKKIVSQSSIKSRSSNKDIKESESTNDKYAGKKSLTKVAMPKVNSSDMLAIGNNSEPKSPDLASEKSDLNSVFEDNPLSPGVETLKSYKSQTSFASNDQKTELDEPSASNETDKEEDDKKKSDEFPPAPPNPPVEV